MPGGPGLGQPGDGFRTRFEDSEEPVPPFVVHQRLEAGAEADGAGRTYHHKSQTVIAESLQDVADVTGADVEEPVGHVRRIEHYVSRVMREARLDDSVGVAGHG